MKSEKAEAKDPKIAFLIEGGEEDISSPEILAAIQLAKLNNCNVFDVIASYDDIHLVEAYKTAIHDPNKLKLMVLHVLNMFEKDPATIDKNISMLVKSPFQLLVEEGVITQIPYWVNQLNRNTIIQFEKDILSTFSSKENFEKTIIEITDEMNDLSNEVSGEELIEYLNASPDIDIVYGLVGNAHLEMLGMIGEIQSKNIYSDRHGFIQATLDINGKDVLLNFFGGPHGSLDHYYKLEQSVKEAGLKIPQDIKINQLSTDPRLFSSSPSPKRERENENEIEFKKPKT